MQDRATPHPEHSRRRHRPTTQRLLALRAAVVAPVIVALLSMTDGRDGLALWLVGLAAGAALFVRAGAAERRDPVTVVFVIGFMFAIAVTMSTFDRSFAALLIGAIAGVLAAWASLPAWWHRAPSERASDALRRDAGRARAGDARAARSDVR
jgi:uncharacterized membrane protein YccC